MELHTLGVNGGYTQADVTQVARILTGWTVDRPQRGGGFEFNPNRHEPGTKKVMGQKFKDNGEQEGRALLHFLATRPATAHFISRELAVRFVSDDPPQSLVDRMAQIVYVQRRRHPRGAQDSLPFARVLVHQPSIAPRSKRRSNLSSRRSAPANANIDNLRPVANALRQMGMPVYGCVPPTGYSWQSDTWVSTGALVDRMNFALAPRRQPPAGHHRHVGPAAGRQHRRDVHTCDRHHAVIDVDPPSPEEKSRLESLLVAGGVSVLHPLRRAAAVPAAKHTAD